jgi:hypothetical protein
MPIKWAQTEQEKIEIAEWVAGTGPATPAVKDMLTRHGLSFAAALITRKMSDGFQNN